MNNLENLQQTEKKKPWPLRVHTYTLFIYVNVQKDPMGNFVDLFRPLFLL